MGRQKLSKIIPWVIVGAAMAASVGGLLLLQKFIWVRHWNTIPSKQEDKKERVATTTLDAPLSPGPIDATPLVPSVKIIDPADQTQRGPNNSPAPEGSFVRYANSAFTPNHLLLRARGLRKDECLAAIVNDSDDIVLIRLGPPPAKENWGFLYPPIVPHSVGWIDPRYRGISDPVFYNKNNSGTTFTIHLDIGCAL